MWNKIWDPPAKYANSPQSREEGPGVPTFPHGLTRSAINLQPLPDSTQLSVDPFRGLYSAVGRNNNITWTLLIFLVVVGRKFIVTEEFGSVLAQFSTYIFVKIPSFLECLVQDSEERCDTVGSTDYLSQQKRRMRLSAKLGSLGHN